jgi:hypothetical protein
MEMLMKLLFRPINAAAAALLVIAPWMATTSGVSLAYLDPVTHLQWAQLTDFPNTDRATLLSVCTPVCNGTLNGQNLAGWMLASNAQVETLVHDILSTNGLTDPGPGVTRSSPDWWNALMSAFSPNYGVGSTTVQVRGWFGYTFDGAGGISLVVTAGGGGSEQYATFPRASDSMVCGVSSGCGAWLVEPGSCPVNTVASFSNQQPVLNQQPVMTAAAGSNTGSDPAAVQPKSAGLGTLLNPATFRRLRDDRLMRSPAGRRYAALYEAHGPELVRLVVTNAALRSSILNGLLAWQGTAAAIAEGPGQPMTITAAQARAVDEIANQLARAGSPALRKAIEDERHKQLPGFTFAETVLRESGLAVGSTDPNRR